MVRPTLRLACCGLVGLLAGSLLGPVLVPNPTGILAATLTLVVAATVGVGLYRTDWLRERPGSE